MSKKNKQYQLWIGLGLIVVAVVVITVALLNAMKGESTGDVEVGEESKFVGLVCRDAEVLHPALKSKSVGEHTNTITANFQDDKLHSLSLLYEGNYGTESMAKEAEAFAMADYNLTLTNDYGEKNDIFSVNYLVDGPKLQIVQTARDISKINEKTVSYFLLDKGTNIAKTLDGLKKQYEAKGFSCEKSE